MSKIYNKLKKHTAFWFLVLIIPAQVFTYSAILNQKHYVNTQSFILAMIISALPGWFFATIIKDIVQYFESKR